MANLRAPNDCPSQLLIVLALIADHEDNECAKAGVVFSFLLALAIYSSSGATMD